MSGVNKLDGLRVGVNTTGHEAAADTLLGLTVSVGDSGGDVSAAAQTDSDMG
jgi:hypothetical protein